MNRIPPYRPFYRAILSPRTSLSLKKENLAGLLVVGLTQPPLRDQNKRYYREVTLRDSSSARDACDQSKSERRNTYRLSTSVSLPSPTTSGSLILRAALQVLCPLTTRSIGQFSLRSLLALLLCYLIFQLPVRFRCKGDSVCGQSCLLPYFPEAHRLLENQYVPTPHNVSICVSLSPVNFIVASPLRPSRVAGAPMHLSKF